MGRGLDIDRRRPDARIMAPSRSSSSSPSRVDRSRRSFLFAAGALAAAPALGLAQPGRAADPSATTTATAKAKSKNDRLQVGFIGTGNQGMGLLKRFLQWDLGDVVAVCDVNEGSHGYREPEHFYGREPARQLVQDKTGRNPAAHADFRDVLAMDEVDAVVIVLPDHWHAPASIAAARAGKHIYCEKPLTLTLAEGQPLADEVAQAGVTFQVGSHERSRRSTRWVCERVLGGAIGEVSDAATVVGFNNKVGPGPGWQPQPVPDGFDYADWLGPATEQPYHPDRCLYRFRFNYDYSGGQVTNFGAHSLDIAQWGLDKQAEHAAEVVCTHAKFLPEGSLFNTALESDFRLTYADGTPITCTSDDAKVQCRFNGADGWIQTGYAGTTASRPELIEGVPPQRAPKGELDAHSLHLQNFVQACAGKAELNAPLPIGRAAAELCHLANVAIRRFPEHGEQVLKWNGEAFTDPVDANALRGVSAMPPA